MKIDIQKDHYNTIGEIIRVSYILAGLSLFICAGAAITFFEWITGGDNGNNDPPDMSKKAWENYNRLKAEGKIK